MEPLLKIGATASTNTFSRDNLFWEPYVETDVDWAASIRIGGVSTNQICSSGCLPLDQPPPRGPCLIGFQEDGGSSALSLSC
jgi:hypothetical protein